MPNKISFFSGNVKNLIPDKEIDIIDFLNFVKYGEFKELQLEISRILDHKKRRDKKAQILPYVTISGVFNRRTLDGLLQHSGLIAMDFDDVEDFDATRKKLNLDPYSFAVFKSVSGLGLCVLVKVTPSPDKQLAHFNWLSKYYYEKYGYVIDISCKDHSRARFVSYDPELYINEKSKKAGVKQEAKAKPKKINFIATESQMDRIVSDICNRGINITESYEEYLRVGMAIASEYGEGGRNYFHACSSMSSKYNEKEADKKYNNCIKTSSRIKIGTFFYMAKQAGIELYTEEERKAFGVALAAKRSNSTVEGAVKTATTIHAIPEELANEAAKAVFDRDSTDIYQADEDTPVIEQITNYLDINHTFKKNEITRIIEDEHGREMNEQYENTIYVKAKALIGNKVVKKDIECIINSDRTELFNPFKEFYEKHSALDHRPETINEFISALSSPTENYQYWVRKWLLGLPAASNGDIVRIVLVFCGGQYSGKTTWFRWILPKELRRYYAESNLDRGKDDEIGMTQNLIVMDDEFGGKSRKDAEKFKELVSKETFFLREPYGRRNVHLKRLSLIAGTANDSDVINDPTGNTRIVPIAIDSIDFSINEAIDRTQLFIELWRAWERGEKWNLDSCDLDNLAEYSSEHEEVSIERELLNKFFTSGNTFYTTTEIKNHLEVMSVQKIFSVRKLGIELKKIYPRISRNGLKGYRLTKIESHRADNWPSEMPDY